MSERQGVQGEVRLRGRHHSVSSTNRYLECPKSYEFSHVKKIRVEGLSPMHWRFGSVVHDALEGAYREYATMPENTPLVSMGPVALLALEASWKKNEMPTHGGDMDRAKEAVLGVLASDDVRPSDILGVEHKFYTTTEDGSIVIGYADLVVRTPGDTIKIRDWKVRSRATPAEVLATDYQLNLYGLLSKEYWPWATRVYASHYYPPIQHEVVVQLSEDGMADALSRFEAVVEMTEMDTEFKPRPSERCSDCLYATMCPAMEATGVAQALLEAKGF